MLEKKFITELEKCYDLESILNSVQRVISSTMLPVDPIFESLIEVELLEEIREIVETMPIFFGATLRDLKCVYIDDNLKAHEIFIRYLGPKQLEISAVDLPISSLQERKYQSLKELINSFQEHLGYISDYVCELDRIDRFCTVVEPSKPTLKTGYRKIELGDRVWLHLEVSQEGQATNLFLIGQFEEWRETLQDRLLNWNHDLEIVENICQLHDLIKFPESSQKSCGTISHELNEKPTEQKIPVEEIMCMICMCPELSETFGQPQPLCQNKCGSYFHRHCLFQWLVSSTGGRPPAFSVATGSCPICFKSIACSERD